MKTRQILAVSVAVGTTFLPGCGGNNGEKLKSPETTTRPTVSVDSSIVGPADGAPAEGILNCIPTDAWESTPANINLPAIADQLGVSSEQVFDGRWGPAHCDKAIAASQTGSKAIVQGIGATCLVVGTMSQPEAGKIYDDLLLICAQDTPS